MKSNLDALEAMIAEQKAKESEAKAKAEESKSGFQAKWSKRGESQASGESGSTQDREQILEMCSKVDLLSLAQADTGETGRRSGNRVDFHNCPLCGHKDCFTVYADTNTCACYSESNPNTKGGKIAAGGNVLDYLRYARHDGDNVAAMTELHELSGIPYQPKDRSAELDEDEILNGWNDDSQGAKEDNGNADGNADQDAPKLKLPEWTAIQSTDPPSRNPVLIDGVLRLGHVGLLAGKGKIGKSWSAIELCVSVATGRAEWFGLPLKSSGACLYIDPELDPKSLDNRFQTVCNAMKADTAKTDSLVAKWPLRGIPDASMDAIIHDLKARCEQGKFALVVIDSCSCFVEGDENKSVDVRKFAAKVLQVTKITGATVLLVHHFGKAKDGDRSAADRARGSSVWLDFPDAVLTLTEILPPSGQPSDYLKENEYACILESGGIREFPRMEPKRLIFGYPVHRVDDEGITESWKPASSERDGGKKTAELNKAKAEAEHAQAIANLLAYYYSHGIGKDGLLFKDALAASGVSDKTLKKALDGCEHFELVRESQRKRYVRPTKPPDEQPPTLDV